MALRVLLADESTTIRKVFQLTLQDYAVEVKSVHVGVDVIPVTESFKPDIIFADVLLQKKTGYDVCSEVKAHKTLSHLPVVLMWSSFMELDEDKFQASAANDHLEKPFDVDRLRGIIHNLVPKTKSSPVSKYLDFPKMPDFEEDDEPAAKEVSLNLEEPSPSQSLGSLSPSAPDGLSLDAGLTTNSGAGDDISEFREVQLSSEVHSESLDSKPAFELFTPEEDEDEGWVRQTLPKFRVDEGEDLLQTNIEDEIDHIVNEDPIQAHEVAAHEGPASMNLTEVPGLPNESVPGLPNDDHTHSAHTIDETELEGVKLSEIALDEDPGDHIVESNDTQLRRAAQGTLSASTSSTLSAPTPDTVPEQLDEIQLEKVIRAQSREVIESVVWKVVPEIATEMIEREIKRLLAEVEPRA